ncbi:MAG TPA: isocitrate/isopropylmalate family dehydrogenase [Kofleriaceae bacterium]|jgi:3-isopropylmalate dehydrogenase
MSRSPKSTYDLVLLPGDGIGVEVMGHARQLLDVIARGTGCAFAIDEIPCGGKFYLEHGSRDWPEGAEDRCRAADAILLGAVGWNGPDGAPATMRDASGEKMAGWSPVIGNRLKLDLYANIRPVRCLLGTRHGLSGKFREVWAPETVDMVIIRENTEGLYSGIAERTADRATDLRVITRRASERVIRAAFELSRRRDKGAPVDGKRRVTCIVKHNVLAGCRLFLDVFREVARGFSDIEADVAIVDSFAMFVLTQPERYDVCVTTNMFGDILTDLASVLQGGMGMAVGCNVGDDHAMFEPIHGSAPPLAGKDRANPMAMMLAAGEAMAWLGRRFSDDRLVTAHRAIETAVAMLVERGEPLTVDLGGSAPQSVVAAAVRDEVARRLGCAS